MCIACWSGKLPGWRGPVCFDGCRSRAVDVATAEGVGKSLAVDSENSSSEGRDTTVFFSYSRADQELAQPIIRLLEDAGFTVWWDGVLEAGVQYIETTEEALETAKAVVVLWSKTSVASNWVRDEAMSGRERGCLLPLSIDGSLPPLGFRQFQVTDFAGWRGDSREACAQQLLRAAAALHDREVPDRGEHPQRLIPSPDRRRLLLMGLGGIVAIGGGLAISGFFGEGSAIPGNGLVVLPFNNDGPDPELDYLSEGLSTELRSILARNPALRVVARSSSEVVKDRALDAVSVARELGVDFVVEGAVRVTGNLVQVTSDLIDGATGISRWSQIYELALDDLLGLQETLASSISSQLSQDVSTSLRAARLGATASPAAFDVYLRAWNLYRKSNSEETDLEVLALFDAAIGHDERFAAAHSGRALVLTTLGNTSTNVERSRAYHDDALASARRAVELAPELDQTQSILGVTLFHTKLDIAGAREPFDRSIELGGGSATIQARYAEYAALTGRPSEAVGPMALALALDPLNPYVIKGAAIVHYAAGRYDQSIELNRQALELDQSTSSARAWIGFALLQMDQPDAAIESSLLEPYALQRHTCLAIAHLRLGNEQAAQAALADLISEYGDAGLYQQAQVMAQWNRPDESISLLTRAKALGDVGLIYLGIDPLLAPLRSRDDFIALQVVIGFT